MLDISGIAQVIAIVFNAIRLQPLPVSAILLYDCTTCSHVLEDKNYHMRPEDNAFFIHLHLGQVDKKTHRMKPSAEYQFKKALSSMRNSDGGALFVDTCENIIRPDTDLFQSFVVPVLGTMLTDEETMSCGFSWHPVESGGRRMYKINVLPSDTFMTVDMKTKLLVWCRDKNVSASFEKLRPFLLFPRNVSTTEPIVQGLSHMDQADAVKIYVDDIHNKHVNYPLFTRGHSVSVWVNRIIERCSLPEYITSISKRKHGGSVYVGMRGHYKKLNMNVVPLPRQVGKHELQSMLAEELQKKISVFKNRHSDIVLKPKDVFQIEIHDTGTNSGIIEVAVRPVNGCVFYDALGPMSFRIENKSMDKNRFKVFVRLPFDEWMEKASG